MADKNVKYRHELKYLCSAAELENIRCRLSAVMKLDSHVDKTGMYHIRSIYFDDIHNTCFFENEDGVSPREKWRIRAYNLNPRNISLECKRKQNGMILKHSCKLTCEQFQQLLCGGIAPQGENSSPLLNRFIILQNERRMQPKVIVGYDRKPYVHSNGNVRVTFDTNIFSSLDIDCFFEEPIRKRLILPTGRQLLEVKYDEYIPDHIYHAIQMTNMQQITFSKYYLSRKYSF